MYINHINIYIYVNPGATTEKIKPRGVVDKLIVEI